jgi:hypothetical protein
MTQLNKIIKAVLLEQPGTIMKQGKVDTTGLVVPFNAKKIADLIYNAKGYVVDDEELAKNAIVKNIKNIAQYKQVNSELQKLSDKRGIGAYLGSFMNLTDRLEIAGELMNVLPKNQWEWTIKKIVPWEDFKWINFGTAKNGLPLIARWPGDTPATPLATNTAIKFVTTLYNKDWKTRDAQVRSVINHNALLTAQIVLAFVPVIGWAMSAGVGLGNAKLYYDEGDPKTAGIEAIFSLIPGLGLAGRLGLNKVAPKVMANLGKKVGLKQTKNLTKEEIRILDLLGKNQKALKTELDNYFKTGIKKNVKQIAKDKLKTAAGKFGIGATKISATLGSYITIAQLYGNVYDANVALITDAEMAALDRKYIAQASTYLDKRIAQELGKIKENTQLTTAGTSLTEGLGDVLTLAGLLGTVVGIGSFALKYTAIYKGAVTAYPKLRKLTAFRTVAKDKRFLRSQGMTNAEINALWKSDVFHRADQSLIDGGIRDLQAGTKSPTEVLKLYNDIIPGKGTEKWLQLNSLYGTAKKPTFRWRSPSTTKKTGATGPVTDTGWSAAKFPNITADQYSRIGLNQKLRLNKFPESTWKQLMDY